MPEKKKLGRPATIYSHLIQSRITEEEGAQLLRIAEKEGRSVSNLVRHWVEERLEKEKK
jgi:predicted HicB family RNase H-like nuclease